jgi:prepilin-type N-terminal cleavage/methylation domain-containing protein
MTTLRSTPRQGLTLLEVLITIFVMAIGFLSVLTLFPLAARKIVRSIDSDRVNLMAANASGCDQLLGIRNAIQYQMDQDLGLAPVTQKLQPSLIYHFDPIGVFGGATSISRSLGTLKTVGLNPNALADQSLNQLRTILSLPTIADLKMKEWMTSQDEINFEPWGLPEPNFRKGNRYSVSFLYRRNTLADSNSLETLMLVYAGRSTEFGNDTETPLTLLSPASSSDSKITVQDGVPALQGPGGPDRTFGRGAWLMDISANLVSGQPRWKKFYQVQNVDSTMPGQLTVTLDRNLEADSTSSTSVFPVPANAKLIWVDYLFDWFDRGIGP